MCLEGFLQLLNINLSLTSFQWTGRVPQPGDWPIPARLLQPKSSCYLHWEFSPQNIYWYDPLQVHSGISTSSLPVVWRPLGLPVCGPLGVLEQPCLGLCDSIPLPRSSQGRVSRCLPATSGSISCARNLAPGILDLSKSLVKSARYTQAYVPFNLSHLSLSFHVSLLLPHPSRIRWPDRLQFPFPPGLSLKGSTHVLPGWLERIWAGGMIMGCSRWHRLFPFHLPLDFTVYYPAAFVFTPSAFGFGFDCLVRFFSLVLHS